MEITASLQQTFKKTEVKKNPTYGSEIAQLCKKNYCERDQVAVELRLISPWAINRAMEYLFMKCGRVKYVTFSHEWMWKVLRIQSFGKVKLWFVCEHKQAVNCWMKQDILDVKCKFKRNLWKLTGWPKRDLKKFYRKVHTCKATQENYARRWSFWKKIEMFWNSKICSWNLWNVTGYWILREGTLAEYVEELWEPNLSMLNVITKAKI